MPKYLLEVNYTLEGVRGLKAEGGSARVAAATALIEGLGGKVECFYFGFGASDVFLIADMPDNASVAAAALAVGAGGGATPRRSFSLPRPSLTPPPRSRRHIGRRAAEVPRHFLGGSRYQDRS